MIVNDQSRDNDSPPIKIELGHSPTGLELRIYLWDKKTKSISKDSAGLVRLYELILDDLNGQANGYDEFVQDSFRLIEKWQRSARSLRHLADQIENALSVVSIYEDAK